MIAYEIFCRIRHLHQHAHLADTQIARELDLDERTVAYWLTQETFHPKQADTRPSKLDPFKSRIVRLLESHPYTATQILQQLRETGYSGGFSILKEYVRKVRPPKREAFLTLSFAPGEAAQVDWGQHGTIPVGNTRRRLSFFAMVLCYSRMLYVEFTLSETLDHFLACHQHAFEFFGAVPAKVMVDNLKSAVLRRLVGQPAILHPRYQDFAAYFGFKIVPCGVGQPQEKGRVENSVGYIKKNFLAGLELSDFRFVNPAARQWLDTIANIRCHGTTKAQPAALYAKEKPALHPLNLAPYDAGTLHPVRATNRFRVTWETNTYSVPPPLASTALTLKVYPQELLVYQQERLVARHARSYERQRDFEDPEHPKPLLLQRRKAQDQKILLRFLALTPKAEAFHEQLSARTFNALLHVRKIVALSEIGNLRHGKDRPRPRRRPRIPSLPQRVPRAPPRRPLAPAPRARPLAPDPPPRPPGPRTARAQSGPVWPAPARPTPWRTACPAKHPHTRSPPMACRSSCSTCA